MLSIGVVARQTGVDISTLRKWETRYGFPLPLRRESGQRIYQRADVDTLRLIARRISSGERVGQVIREVLATSASSTELVKTDATGEGLQSSIDTAFSMLQRGTPCGIKHYLEEIQRGNSMREFVENFVAPLTSRVGEAWANGILSINAEHLYASLIENLLIRETDAFKTSAPQRLLLITPAGEKHTLGLAMIHAVLAEAGVSCLRLNSDLPVAEIATFSVLHKFQAVGLSASLHYPPRLLRAQISELRIALAPDIDLWLGGGGIDRISQLPSGTRCFSTFDELIESFQKTLHSNHPLPQRLPETP